MLALPTVRSWRSRDRRRPQQRRRRAQRRLLRIEVAYLLEMGGIKTDFCSDCLWKIIQCLKTPWCAFSFWLIAALSSGDVSWGSTSCRAAGRGLVSSWQQSTDARSWQKEVKGRLEKFSQGVEEGT